MTKKTAYAEITDEHGTFNITCGYARHLVESVHDMHDAFGAAKKAATKTEVLYAEVDARLAEGCILRDSNHLRHCYDRYSKRTYTIKED